MYIYIYIFKKKDTYIIVAFCKWIVFCNVAVVCGVV